MANEQAFEQFTLRGVRVTENELGRGSYAVVMELEYRGLKCAGKKLYRVLYETGIGHAARRYLEECRLLSQTRHPNIVQFLGVCFEESSQFPILVMEFLPTNLTGCLERYGFLHNEISYSILYDVSLGLVYLHSQTPAVLHRDLSANNVLLSTNMTAKISDLGVARILNLTPLQVSQSRMTGTPGTPAYMPPEVMVANPRYDTSVDVFSFGVMVIHTFTAEWPEPKVGQTRIDPANPDRVIGVTEAERREEFLRNMTPDHPLMDLVMRCLNNNPQRRPGAGDIVDRMVGVALEHPPSIENRFEMLQRVSALEAEIVRKDSAIEEKAQNIEALAEEKRRQEEDSASTVERMQLVHSVETDQLKLEIENLEEKCSILSIKDATIVNKDAIISDKDSIIASKDTSLQKKEATIQSLNCQLTKTRDYLTSKPQPLQVQLSCSQCSVAPVKMVFGQAVTINGKVYYGGGNCDDGEYCVYCYDSAQDDWSALPKLPVRWFGLGVVKSEVVVVGGANQSYYASNVVHALANGKNWRQSISPIPTARYSPAVVSLPTHLVVAGGVSDTYINIVEIYNISTSQWSEADRLPRACMSQIGTVCNNTVYLVGGYYRNHLNTVFAAQVDSLISSDRQDDGSADSVWKEVANTPFYHPSAVTISDTIFAVGGIDSEGVPTRRVHAYSRSMDSWLYVGDLPSPVVYAATVPLSSTECLVIGGENRFEYLSTTCKCTISQSCC